MSIEQIKKLREKTGAGMMDCKNALADSNGDFEKAIEYLRKKGAASAQKRSERIAKEGLIIVQPNDSNKEAVAIEINCETDFVSRGEDFHKLAKEIVSGIFQIKSSDLKSILNFSSNGKKIEQSLDDLLAKVGEKIEIKRTKYLSSEKGFFACYNHPGNKIATIVELEGTASEQGLKLGNELAMQVAAMRPIAIDRTQISPAVLEKEKEIYLTQAKNEKKPENIAEKIAANKLEKYFQENCLVEQEYIREPSKTVKDIINEFSKDTGQNFKVTNMLRFQLGETLEAQ